jgi:predicted MPP superfamily phosphohydrolase
VLDYIEERQYMIDETPKMTRRSFLKLMGMLVGETILFGVGGMEYVKHIEPAWVEVSQVRLKLPRLSKAFDGFRLVQLSDVHMGGWMDADHFAHAMKLALAQKPDMLALTGDYIEHQYEQVDVPAALSALSTVFNTMGDVPRVGVMGNHDHRTGLDTIRALFEQHQIMDLTNAVHTIERGGERLHIAGVDDPREGNPDLPTILDALPEDGAAILLSHEPDFADKSAATGRFDLQISGHSHGGQIVLPFIGPPMLPWGGHKYYSGLYQVGNMLQYTNRGIGMTIYYFRLNCRPEITVYTLEAG